MTLLNTINHAGKRIFLHFHDAWEESVHPRGGNPSNPGQFSKGSGGKKAHPTSSPGSVVVNPIAKVLKEHGYIKQKGGNVYQHPTGHEVEVHAAAEGQKWLTGWTHGTSGQTGSGAGKLDKHLQLLPHGLPSQKAGPAGEPPDKLYEYGEEAEHSSPTIHSEMTSMGFTPKIKTVGEQGTTTYEHPTKGEVVIDNEMPSNGKIPWKYYKDPNATEPTATGAGVVQNLGNAINAHFPSTSSYTPSPVAPPVYEPPSVITPQSKVEHPFTKVHSALLDMGFAGETSNGKSTVYVHPTKGSVEIKNTAPHSGPHKNKVSWSYTPPFYSKPTDKGYGIANGALQQAISLANLPTPTYTPKPVELTPTPLSVPAHLVIGTPKSIESYYFPQGSNAEKAYKYELADNKDLVVGQTTGNWEITDYGGGTGGVGTIAQGQGQQSLNEAFEKLHPRGAGGKFIAKPGGDVPFVPQPGSKEETLASQSFYSPDLMSKGFKPYGEDQNNLWFEKNNLYVELSKTPAPSGDYSWIIVPPDEKNIKGESLANLMGKLNQIETKTAPPTNIPTPQGVDEKDHNILINAGYKPVGSAPWGEGSVKVYAQEDGSIVLTKPKPNGMNASIFPLSEAVFKQSETVAELEQLLGGKYPKIGVVPNEPNETPVGASSGGFDYSSVPVHGLIIPQHPGVAMAGPQAMPSGNVRVSINQASQTLVVRKDGTWQLYDGNFVTGVEGTIAEGKGQTELNAAFINKYGAAGGAVSKLPINPNNYTTNIASGPKGMGAYTFPNTETSLGYKSFIEEDADKYELTTGQYLVLSKKSNIWELIDNTGATLEFGQGPIELNNALVSHGITVPSFGSVKPASGHSASMLGVLSGIFKPLQSHGFNLATDETTGLTGILNNDPDNIKMAFNYNTVSQKGFSSWQIEGDPAGSHTFNFNGPPVAFSKKIEEQYQEAKAASGPPAVKVEHFDKSSSVPAELNGVKFASWIPPLDWSTVEGQNEHIQEPPMVLVPGKKQSAGLLIEEPDGRIWIVKPKGEYQGVKFTFPKGGQEAGDSLQATAIKEAWEESGLKAEITGFAGDYLGTTSKTRYYLAKRTGGTPLDFGAESEQVSLVPKEELGKYLNQTRDLQIAKDHFAPKAIGHPIQLNDLTKVGEKKGSNPGGIYKNAEGKQFYVKHLKSNQHVANELLAADLMARAGGGTLHYHAVHGDGGKISVGTEWEALQKDNVSKLSLNEKRQAQSDFAINAWLANWDAAGTGGDNVGVLNGKTITLDVGGSLLYRAQGEPKGDLFGYVPYEWNTLRTASKNPDAQKLYGDMTDEQLKESAAKLNSITNKDIKDAVDSHFEPGSAVADSLTDKLIARRDKIIQYAAEIQVAPKPTSYTPTATKPTPPPAAPVQHKAGVGTKVEGGGYSSGYVTSPTEPSKDQSTVYSDLTKLSTSYSQVDTDVTYYKGSGYNKINDCMRYSDDCDHIKQVKPIRDFIDKSPRIPKPLTLFRGVRNKHGFTDAIRAQIEYAQKANKPFRLKDQAFMSVTTDHNTAKGFAGYDGITFIIEVPAGSHGASVHNHHENELLMQQGSLLIITGEKDPLTGYYKAKLDQSHMVG